MGSIPASRTNHRFGSGSVPCHPTSAVFLAHNAAMRFGLRLMTELFEHLNPMPYGDAQYMEVDLGIRLRAQGFGVWQS